MNPRQDTTCIGLRFFFEAAREQGISVERLIEGVPYPFDHLNDPHERIDWESFSRCCQNIEAAWTDDELVELGGNVIYHEAYRYLRVVYRVLFSADEMYVQAMTKQWTDFYPHVRSTIDRTPNGFVIELEVEEGLGPARALFLAQKGALTTLPHFVGLDHATVEMDVIEPGLHHRYTVVVPRGRHPLVALRQAVSRPFLARSAASELREAHDLLQKRHAQLQDEVDERRRLETKMQQAQKLESLGVLAGGIAHDFNNLLVGIQGNAELALGKLEKESPARRYIEDLQRAGQRAAELTRSMLAYAGRRTLATERFDLSATVREMTRLLVAGLTARAELRQECDTPVWVDADTSQICQVVMNLVTNAAESLGDDGSTIQIRTGTTSADRSYLGGCLGARDLDPGEYAFVEVRDDGCGMDESTLKRVFDPFFTTKTHGRGLGLAAVLGIVNSHRGALRVETAPGEGTTFRVLLPSAPPRPDSRHGNDIGRWRGEGKLLLVDDDVHVRRVTAAILATMGFDVVSAADGEEAVRQFERDPDDIRAVIVDSTMTGMDGDATLRGIRRVRTDVPAVVISGFSRAELAERLARHESVAFLQKPFTGAQMAEKLKSLLPSA